jgi:hypothetical protein
MVVMMVLALPRMAIVMNAVHMMTTTSVMMAKVTMWRDNGPTYCQESLHQRITRRSADAAQARVERRVQKRPLNRMGNVFMNRTCAICGAWCRQHDGIGHCKFTHRFAWEC